MSGAVARLAVVGALLGAVTGLGSLLPQEPPGRPAPRSAPVVGAVAVCPEVRADGARGSTALSASGPADGLTAGRLVADPARVGPGPLDTTGADGSAWVVRATGPEAGRLAVVAVTRATTGLARGTAVTSCPAPATSSWFAGADTTVGSTSELVLVNADEGPALVDVRAWSADGPADPRPGRGIPVPAGARVVVPLDRLVPDRAAVTLHVATSRGRVAAAVRLTRADRATPAGVDWLPVAAPPVHEAVVAGVPAGPGSRTLLVTNPGRVDLTVSVQLTTTDGQPAAVPLDVPAGRTATLDLTTALAATPAAVRVVSDGGPVLAGAVVSGPTGGLPDLAAAGASGPLGQAAPLLPLAPLPAGLLLLSAVTGDGAVELVGPAGTRPVAVPAGTTVAVPLSDETEVRPVRGQVHAGRWAASLVGSTSRPLDVPRLQTPRPLVRADPGAGR